jgi:hypothetical protein
MIGHGGLLTVLSGGLLRESNALEHSCTTACENRGLYSVPFFSFFLIIRIVNKQLGTVNRVKETGF